VTTVWRGHGLGAMDRSMQHGQERPVEKRERPHSGGMERREGELGWKTKGERPRHIGRIRPERRSQGDELGDSGQKWRGQCHLRTC
jgi:hypothetical protein